MRGSLLVKTGSANGSMIGAPWEARKSQSYTVSEAKSTQRAALIYQAAGTTKKCFGSIRIRKERYTIPQNDLNSQSMTNPTGNKNQATTADTKRI